MYAAPRRQWHPTPLKCAADRKERTELRDKAEDAIMAERMTSKWRDDHPEAVYFQGPPLLKQYEADVPDPEPLPVRDWNDFELRAFVEKRHWQANEAAVWNQHKQDIGRCAVACDADPIMQMLVQSVL